MESGGSILRDGAYGNCCPADKNFVVMQALVKQLRKDLGWSDRTLLEYYGAGAVQSTTFCRV